MKRSGSDIIKKTRKTLITGLILIIILFLTFNTLYDKESLVIIAKHINNIKPYYMLICLVIVITYFLCQALYMRCILKTLNVDVKIKTGMFYSMVEFFYSGITPSASGGQPTELYYMTKDHIPLRKSYITLILNTTFFKIILVILGIIVLLFNNSFIINSRPIYKLLFTIGFLTDTIVIATGLILIFKVKLIKIIYNKLSSIFNKFKILNKITTNTDYKEFIEKYDDEIKFIKSHKRVVSIAFLITFIQRILLFSVIYVIYRALGFNTYSYFDLLSIQVCVQLAIEFAPVPGGAGICEGMLHNLFTSIFAASLANVGMLLTRTFTFYVPMILSGLVILINKIIEDFKTKRIV